MIRLFAPFSLVAANAVAQLPPVRALGPIVATSSEALQSVPSIRPLADGHLLVSDLVRRRLVLLDSALASPVPVLIPNGNATNTFPARGGLLLGLPGDT